MNEQIKNGVVICDNCNWKWNIADGGEDTYLCHKCNHDNTPINEHKSISLSNLFQEIINEAIKKDYNTWVISSDKMLTQEYKVEHELKGK